MKKNQMEVNWISISQCLEFVIRDFAVLLQKIEIADEICWNVTLVQALTHWGLVTHITYESGHETAAVLLPGFAINW